MITYEIFNPYQHLSTYLFLSEIMQNHFFKMTNVTNSDHLFVYDQTVQGPQGTSTRINLKVLHYFIFYAEW